MNLLDQREVDQADSVDAIATLLNDDPVVVQTLQGAGDSQGAHDALTALREKVDFPVYIALVQQVDGLASERPAVDLASQLHRTLGEDGCYVVATAQSSNAITCFGVKTANRPGVYDLSELHAVIPSSDVTTPAGFAAADILSTADMDLGYMASVDAFSVPESPPAPGVAADSPDELLPLVMSSLVFVMVLIVLPVTIWRVSVARRALAKAGQTSARAKQRHTEDQAKTQRRLTRDIEALEKDVRRIAAPAAQADLADRALVEARIYAASADTLDMAGAEVLLAIATHALSDGSDWRYQACGFNPHHGKATSQATAEHGHLPCCTQCRTDLNSGAEPVSLKQRGRPYFEGDSVWAATGFGALVEDLPAALAKHRAANGGQS